MFLSIDVKYLLEIQNFKSQGTLVAFINDYTQLSQSLFAISFQEAG